MSKRWQPEKGEEYWNVNDFAAIQKIVWRDDKFDRDFYEIGNCFKTAAEAKAAADKFRELLLSLHDEPVTNCNQLPKLTAEVFDRPDCPEWAKCAMVNGWGNCLLLDGVPHGTPETGYMGYNRKTQPMQKWGIFDSKDDNGKFYYVERPAKLPDWCKVGEWCYCLDDLGNDKYFKITEIKGEYLYGDDWDVSVSFVKQARLRPYNADEMRGLVGKILERSDGSRNLLTDYNPEGHGWVYVNYGCQTAEDLIIHEYTIDGNPCGVLEHLDNGEWKE